MRVIKPPRLKIGDTVGICSPCMGANPEIIEPSAQTLREIGYKVKLSKNLYSLTDGYAASLEERVDDLNDLLRDDTVDMVIFGGGEIGNELLPCVDYDAIVRRPKIIGSFSDGTTLLEAIHAKTGLVTFYGVTPRVFCDRTPYNLECVKTRLTTLDTIYKRFDDWTIIREGRCEGVITGGYLVNFAAMLGGQYFSWNRNEKYLLLLEDHEVFSKPCVVSKWLSHISQSGLMDNVTGLFFGLYSDEHQSAIDDVLRRFGDFHNIPVVHCRDFGHGEANAVYPIGIRAAFDTVDKTFSFGESGVQ